MDRRRLIGQASKALQRSDLDSARPLCARLLSQLPNDSEVLELNAELLLRSGSTEKALRLLSQSLTLDAKRVSTWLKLSEAHDQNGDPKSAGSILEEAVRRFPREPTLRYAHAKICLEFGLAGLALQQLRAAEQLASFDADGLLLMAQTLMSLRRNPEAKAYLAKSVDQYHDIRATTLLGFLLQAEGSFDGAREHFLAAIKIDPTHAAAYHGYAQGKKFSEEDRPFLSDAKLISDKIDVAVHDRMALHYVLGKGYEDLDEFETSFRHYRQANELAMQVNRGGKGFPGDAHERLLVDTLAHFGAEDLLRADPAQVSKRVPIFVVGMMRSGTTLVEQILSSHPDVIGGGELDFWPDHHRESFDHASIPRLRNQYEELLKQDFPGPKWVVDKMPQNYQSLGAIHLAFPNSPLIHLRRSPRDTCLSIYTTAYSLSPDFAHDLDSIRIAYLQYLRYMEHWRESLPQGRLIEIDYEQLVNDPVLAIRELAQRLELEWDESILNHQANRRLVKTPSAWQARQPISTGSIGRWRRFEPWIGPLMSLPEKEP